MLRRRPRNAVPVHNLKVSRKGKIKKRTFLWRMRRVFYIAGLAVVVGAAGLIYILRQVELPVDPKLAPVEAQTSFICSSEVQVNCNSTNAMAQLHGEEDRVLVTYDQIPEVLREAVLSAEDKDFFEHGGVDPVGIARAAYRDIRGEGVRQGGSTITQQYVKQAYLNSEQTFNRKIKEAVMAVKLEQEVSKEEILTRYLNTVYFGRGAYGVQAASRAWFSHDLGKLDAGEAAFLAGLLRNPNGADPYRGPDSLKEAIRRRHVVLVRMEEDGYVTADERAAFEAVSMDPDAPSDAGPFIQPPPKASVLGDKVKGKEWGSEYFAEYVRLWLLGEFGETAAYTGGLKVYTTLDLDMQKAAYEAVTSTLDRPGDPAASIVAIDDQGQVKAMMAGRDYATSQVNLATGGGGTGRQPGSTFKMFALADAVKKGYSIRSVLPAPSKVKIPLDQCPNGSEEWEPRGGPGGPISMISATRNSTNTFYAQLMARMTPKDVVALAKDMGVSADVDPLCAVVLGGEEVSTLDMAAGYSTLANGGVAKSPIVVTRVEFPDGRVYDYAPDQKQVLTPEQTGRVTYALRQVIDGGTGKAAAFGRPAAGKTGTTQDNADAWFVGYTPKLTAAVWMGYPEGRISMSNVHGIEVQGGTFPAEMWRKFMTTATADFDTGDFPEFDAEVLGAGEPLDPNYGKSGSISSGSSSGGGTGAGTGGRGQSPATTAAPQTTAVPQTTAPATTAPPTTAPPTTAPPTTAPPTTAPAATGQGEARGRGVGVTGR
ncbi:MAG: transglycosylase domain-containing protein [Acidimicrobiales bacterium]|nr:transglycosylase domain-containing protein [Acidimicrobiales bacterium]HRW38928.1 transglycosylase domain-containing protein [Aquihabitans sp.]